jgi:hypothetical protein
MQPPNKWFALRLLVIVVFASGGRIFPHDVEPVPWIFAPFGFFAAFLGLFAQSSFRISSSGTRCIWRRPSWYENPFTNPFKNTQPLQFFHMGAFCFMCLGLVMFVFGPWDWSRGLPFPFFVFSFGLGVWTFVRVFCLVYGRRMDESNRLP